MGLTLRGIDVLETEVDGLVDLAGGLFERDTGRAVADRRDQAAVVERDVFKGHGVPRFFFLR